VSDAHSDRIRDAFTRQATTFERADLNSAFTSGMPWLVSLAQAVETDTVLDVAGGTGLVARALAPSVRSATVVDTTPAMLDAGREGAAREGYRNVEFVLGDAEALPFPDRSFSLVVTRFSLHHFEDPAPMLDEIVRVTATEGRVVVKDLVSSSDPRLAEHQDDVERLRDDSHVRMPTEGAVAGWLRRRGTDVLTAELRSFDRPLEPWLAQSVTPPDRAEQVRELLRAELDGGEPTGMRPHLEHGELWFHQTWETTVARRS
jgi:ubiquinone/menaquinone biosynthesis C-methylase UbiE